MRSDAELIQEVATQHVPVAKFDFEDMKKIARSIADSKLFGLSSPNDVLVMLLQAQAEGQHPATVVRDNHVINGKPSKKTEAMLRDFLAAGGNVEWHELTDEKADATFSHPQGGTIRIDWDMERAKRADLTEGRGGMYDKYPRPMLRSRCQSEGIRTIYPAATSGMHTPEELLYGEVVNDGAKTAELNAALGTEPAVVEGGETKDEGPAENTDVHGVSVDSPQEPAPQPSANRREVAKEQFKEDCMDMNLDYEPSLASLLTLVKKDAANSLTAEDYSWAHDNPGALSSQVQYDLAKQGDLPTEDTD